MCRPQFSHNPFLDSRYLGMPGTSAKDPYVTCVLMHIPWIHHFGQQAAPVAVLLSEFLLSAGHTMVRSDPLVKHTELDNGNLCVY